MDASRFRQPAKVQLPEEEYLPDLRAPRVQKGNLWMIVMLLILGIAVLVVVVATVLLRF